MARSLAAICAEFTDLVRRANVDAVVRRALTGHVTEQSSGTTRT